jgi:uncharacterized membrane protein YhaH (DUF805 family)
MFKNPFSFSGRIRRLEYGLSYIIFLVSFFILGIFSEILEETESIIFFLILPVYWFIIAQGTKRCHDLGNSGFFQLIPFYGLVMIFSEGQHGLNKYGYNPKDHTAPIAEHKPFKLKVVVPSGKTRIDILNEMICIALLNTLLIVLLMNYVTHKGIKLLLISFSIIPCYFLLLILSHKKNALPDLKPYLFRHRLMFASILFISIQLYNLAFNNDVFNIETIVLGVFIILLILGMTYIPFILYPKYLKKRENENEINSQEIIK